MLALQPRPGMPGRFGLVRVRSPLLTESRLLSSPGGTEMFQFPPFAPPAYGFGTAVIRGPPGRRPLDGSPGIIAVFHALRRLPAPRHPPPPLSSFAAPAPA